VSCVCALSICYDYVERLAASSGNGACRAGPCVPWEDEVLVINSIADRVYGHCDMMGGVDPVVEYLGRVEDGPGLIIVKVSPKQEPVSHRVVLILVCFNMKNPG